MRLLVVSDSSGRVIGATHEPPADSDVQWGFEPLDGQTVTAVDIPDHLKHLETDDRLAAVLKHELPKGAKELRALSEQK